MEVPHEGVGLFRAASSWTGRIVAATEYWSGPATDPVPAWRVPYVERY